VRVAVCEDLAYPEERIAVGDIAAPPQPAADLYSLVIGDF
jgi:cobalt-precorrin-7 (C5)-methyltransferase